MDCSKTIFIKPPRRASALTLRNILEPTSEKHGRDLTFVYGYVGDETGPDQSRRGWVVYHVLDRA